MDDKSVFDKIREFFHKDNHEFVADAAKVGLWAVLLLNFNKATEWLGLKINEALVSERYEQASAKARKLWNGIVFGLKLAMAVIMLGWLAMALILYAATFADTATPAGVAVPSKEQVYAVIAIAVELAFALVTGALILVQQIKAHALVQLAIAAENVFGSGVAFVKSTLPKCVVPGADQRIDRKILDLAAGLDKGRKIFWAIIWWLKVLEIVVVNAIWVGYFVFNTLILVLLIVNIAIAFVAYKNAYGADTKRFREWGFRYLVTTVAIGFAVVALMAVMQTKIGKVIGIDQALDARIAKNADESKAKAETDKRAKKAQADMRQVKDAQNEIAAERAEAAAKDLPVVQGEIETLEKKGLGKPLSKEDRDKLAFLVARWKWDLDGRSDRAPEMKVSTCQDGIDNNGDGYADDEDFSCWKEKTDCTKKEKKDGVCRSIFANANGGEPITRVGSDGKDHTVWYVYDKNREEKKTEAKAEAKKPEPTAAASNPPAQHHANGKGAAGPSEYQKLIAWKCAQNPQWCQKQ